MINLQVSDLEGFDPLVLVFVLRVGPPEESVFRGQPEKRASLRVPVVHLLFGLVADDENSVCWVLCKLVQDMQDVRVRFQSLVVSGVLALHRDDSILVEDDQSSDGPHEAILHIVDPQLLEVLPCLDQGRVEAESEDHIFGLHACVNCGAAHAHYAAGPELRATALDTGGATIILTGLVRPFQVLEEGLGPTISRMLADVVVSNLKPLLLLILRHVQGQVNVLGDLIYVVRVDFEDTPESPVAPRELREYDRCLILSLKFLLHRNKLQGREALAITQGGDQEDISHGPQSDPLLHQEILFLVVDGALPELLLYFLD